ncbi:MAG TPA: LytR family transcriptional regulator [Bacteroidetes bacterium]|nr:LytR family transcriptional regulator [Bacteroidota bacterium]
MAVRRTRRTSAPKTRRSTERTVRRRSKSRGASGSLLTVVIWILAVVNLVLVGSLVSRFVAPKPAQQAAILAEDSLKVEVLNGCGKPGLAKEVTDYLRRQGFDVVNFGNYVTGNRENFNIKTTMVIDRRSMDMRNALKVAEALGVDKKNVLVEMSAARALDVTVVLGKDYRTLKLYRN